jgi:hypothetical protein
MDRKLQNKIKNYAKIDRKHQNRIKNYCKKWIGGRKFPFRALDNRVLAKNGHSERHER